VYIEGRIQTRSWEDQNGVKKYSTEIVANNMQLLGRRGDEPEQLPQTGREEHLGPDDTGSGEDDLPF